MQLAQPSPPKIPASRKSSLGQNKFLETTRPFKLDHHLPPAPLLTMGKGKGKKGKREPRSAANKIPQAAKVRAPRPVNPVKKAKKLLSKEKKEAKYNPPLGADMETIEQLAHDRVMRNLVHAKWPALFKKHMGVVESHIKALDRVMSSMKTQMDQMSKKERMEWELGERGNWRVLCEMMDRARQVLADTKKSAEGIVSSRLYV